MDPKVRLETWLLFHQNLVIKEILSSLLLSREELHPYQFVPASFLENLFLLFLLLFLLLCLNEDIYASGYIPG